MPLTQAAFSASVPSTTRQALKKLVAVAQEIVRIGNEVTTELSRLATEQVTSDGNDLAEALQGLLKTMPGQNTNVTEAIQAAIGNANSAYQQIASALTSGFQTVGEAATKTSGRAKK